MDARVAVAVADVQVAVGRHGEIGRPIERAAGFGDGRRGAAVVAAGVGRVLGWTQLEDLLAVERVSGDAVVRIVDEVQRVVFAHVHPVRCDTRTGPRPTSPRKWPLAVVDHDRVVAPTEQVHVAAANPCTPQPRPRACNPAGSCSQPSTSSN